MKTIVNCMAFGMAILMSGLPVSAGSDSTHHEPGASAQPENSEAPEKLAFENFITAKGARLMDGDEEFRFVSFNVPTLLFVEDEMAFEQTNPYALPTEFELRDLFESVRQMGGQVVRNYTIPVRHAGFPKEAVTYVEAPGVFNEEAFKTMDLAIALAGEYGIRIVFPFVNDQEWMGGRPQYAAFRGKHPDEFWTDPQLIADFKRTIAHVLNRVNTITGVPYKDDPTIMAWETGNELYNPPEWAIDIAQYIKSIDPNHMVIDGYNAIHYQDANGWTHIWPREESINHPAIDMINSHHYEPSGLDTVDNIEKTLKLIGGRKPIFVGEFGFISTSGMELVLNTIKENRDVPGALLWSLRRHHKDGGFYHHTEPFGRSLYRAYHYPGFDDGEAYDERNVLAMMREYGWAVQGKSPPKLSPPEAPQLLPFENAPIFSWRGSTGASGYDIERAVIATDEWTQIAYNRDDIETPGFHLFSDTSAQIGESYCYSVRARNSAGVSAPSQPLCTEVQYKTVVDRARNLATAFSSEGVTIATGDNRSFKEAFSRLSGSEDASLTYMVPIGTDFSEMRIFSFEDNADPNLTLASSPDGRSFTEVTFETSAFASSEENYDYLVPIRYRLTSVPEGTRFVKLMFSGSADITRVELDHR